MNKELIGVLYREARKAERKSGIPAIFVVAQAVLESGWELKPIKDEVTGKNSYNVFGIKHHTNDNDFVVATTREYVGNSYKVYNLFFQSYSSYQECFEDHNDLLTKYAYRNCLEDYKKSKDLKKYVKCVSKYYATDPFYARKIMSIIKNLKANLNIKEDEMDEIDKKQKGKLYENKKKSEYEREKEKAKALVKKLGIINNFGLPWDDERAAVVIARLIWLLSPETYGDNGKTHKL